MFLHPSETHNPDSGHLLEHGFSEHGPSIAEEILLEDTGSFQDPIYGAPRFFFSSNELSPLPIASISEITFASTHSHDAPEYHSALLVMQPEPNFPS